MITNSTRSLSLGAATEVLALETLHDRFVLRAQDIVTAHQLLKLCLDLGHFVSLVSANARHAPRDSLRPLRAPRSPPALR